MPSHIPRPSYAEPENFVGLQEKSFGEIRVKGRYFFGKV